MTISKCVTSEEQIENSSSNSDLVKSHEHHQKFLQFSSEKEFPSLDILSVSPKDDTKIEHSHSNKIGSSFGSSNRPNLKGKIEYFPFAFDA